MKSMGRTIVGLRRCCSRSMLPRNWVSKAKIPRWARWASTAASDRNGATARILIRRRDYRELGLRRSMGGEDEQDRDWAWRPAHQRVGDRPRPRTRALAGPSLDAQGRDHQRLRVRRE